MRILAIVPARGGSKRVPGKNVRTLGDKPLICWTLDAAADVPEICDVLVSTDDPATLELAARAGALVPWLRPAELSTDTASSVDVAIHALDWYESQSKQAVDGVMLLQPTSPFRGRGAIERAIRLYQEHDRRPVVSVAPAQSHPFWCYRIEGIHAVPFMRPETEYRSQDLPPAFVLNGAVYLVSSKDLRQTRSFNSDAMVALVMDGVGEQLDIDTEWDWTVAEATLRQREVAGRETRQ